MKTFKKVLLRSILCLTLLAVGFATFSKTASKVNAAPAQSEMDSKIDVVSISDLISQNSITDRGDKTSTYTQTSEHGSVIFKFKYEVTDTANGDSNSFTVYMGANTGANTSIWNDGDGNSLLLRQDGIYMLRWSQSGGKFSYNKTDALGEGLHTVEFGRIYMTSGDNAGKYYTYYIIDGAAEPRTYCYAPYTNVDNKIFWHFGGNNKNNNVYDINYTPTEEKFETAQEINITDLTETGIIKENNDWGSANYTATSNSRIFKFKVAAKTLTDNQGVNMEINGNALKLWIRPDGVFFAYNLDGHPTDKYFLDSSKTLFASNTTYEFELGRLRVFAGLNAGKDLVYLKVNGEYMVNGSTESKFYCDPTAEKGYPWSTADNKVSYRLDEYDLQDMNYGAETAYETADQISIGDLKLHNVGNDGRIVLNAANAYTYNKTADHGSVVLKFKINVAALPEAGDYGYTQIHFAGDYSINCIWLRNDNTFIYKDDKTPFGSGQKAIPAAGEYVIEVGCVYITAGINAGKYYMYAKSNDNLIQEYVTANDYSSNKIFLSGNGGETLYDINYAEEKYAEPAVINIRDIANGNFIRENNGWNNFQYTVPAGTTSRVYKFKIVTKTLTEGYGANLFVNDGACNLWVHDDNGALAFFFAYSLDERPTDKYYINGDGDNNKFANNSVYEVEMGRLRVTEGVNAGKDLVYIKVNGEYLSNGKVKSCFYASANDHGFDANSNVFSYKLDAMDLQDVNYVAPTYEEADVITTGDLTLLDGTKNCNILTINESTRYAYTATAAHKSVVFKFKMTVNAIPEKADYDFGQFHFANDWTNNAIWIRNDNTFIYQDDGNPKGSSKIFAEPGTKEIEIGKLYIVSGEGADNYYIYIKVDGNIINDIVTTRDFGQDANIFITAGNGSKVLYSYNYVDCGSNHTLDEKVTGTPATCTTAGTADYYWCTNCGKYFADAEGTQELTTLVIPAHHTLGELVAEKAGTCTEDGNVAYYQCTVCEKYFADSEATQELTTVTIGKGHKLGEIVAEVPATCTADGTKAYYECSECHKKFADSEATQELTDLVIPAHHTLGELVAAVNPTCDADGNVAYYQCAVCEKYFADANATEELETITVPAQHTLTKVEAKAATCTANGNIEYYHCSECSKNFTDEQAATEATSVVIPKGHTLTKVEAKAATCTEDGNVEYYECSVCNKKYADAEGTTEIASVTVPATGHTYGEDGKCTTCGAVDPDYVAPTPAKKGCKESVTIIALAPLAISALAACVVLKKREQE